MQIEKWESSDRQGPASMILEAVLRQHGESEQEFAASLQIATSDASFAYIASDDRRTLGLLIASASPETRSAFVRWIAVAPDARRSGVGTALVGALAASPGLERITGMVNQNDPVALAFWQERGWTARRPKHGRRRELMGVDLRADLPNVA